MTLVMAIDQGSGSSRALVFDVEAGRGVRALGQASRPVESLFPADRHVEHDAEELYETCRDSAVEALEAAGTTWGDIAGIGVTGQTETVVAWDRESGRAVAPAISWRDQRTSSVMEGLDADAQRRFVALTGLPFAPTWSAPKVRWILDEEGSEAAALARRDRLALGDVASWVTYRLSGGAHHVTEPSFASRTGLMNLGTLGWDPELLAMFDLPASALPLIRPSDDLGAHLTTALVPAATPIVGALGDQQAALYGHGGRRAGQAKLTMGTGAFLWTNAGTTAPAAEAGLVATCAWARRGEEAVYALEGFLPNAGAVVTWLRSLGLLDADAWPHLDTGTMRGSKVRSLPAIAGLGTPYWAPHASARIDGMDSGTSRDEVVQASILGVVQLVADAVDATSEAVPTETILLDGGMSQNDTIAQALADLTGATIQRSTEEATAAGMALLTAHGLGLLAPAVGSVTHDASFTPSLPPEERAVLRAQWQAFVEQSLGDGLPAGAPAEGIAAD